MVMSDEMRGPLDHTIAGVTVTVTKNVTCEDVMFYALRLQMLRVTCGYKCYALLAYI